jgi:DNA sulfur modification protein DndD
MHVYLWFENKVGTNTDSYLLKRSTRPKFPGMLTNYSQIDVNVELYRNGQDVPNITEVIESLLPVAASQFFMFHGEDLRYMSQEHLAHTKKAIELILEANTFRAGIQDLNKIADVLEKEHDEEVAKVEGMQQLVNSKDHFAKKIESDEKALDDALKEMESTKKKLEEIEGELRNREKSKVAMARLDDLRKQKSQLQDDEKKLFTRRDTMINQLAPFAILSDLRKALEKKQVKHQEREELNKKIQLLEGRIELANEISKLEECICGHDITEIERKFIESQKSSFNKRIEDLKSKLVEEDPTYYDLSLTVRGIESSDPDFETLQKDITDVNLRKDEVESAISGIERQLSEIEEEKIKELNGERDDLKRKEGEIDERIRTITLRKKEDGDNKERCVKLIQQREKAYSISTVLEEQHELAEKCHGAFDFVLSQLSVLRKTQIMENSTKYFSRLTNKPEEYTRIDIDDDYNVRVVDSKGNVIFRPGLSTGEREIVALSFILGLKSASEKVAPLILDTFFVHLDESHYTNIVREMPSFADQTVLILTDLEYKNLRERAPNSFFDAVNHIWQINRIQVEERSEPTLIKEGETNE